MVVLPVPDGAETTNSVPAGTGALLDILHLLLDPFELGLRGDDHLGGARALRLRPYGIDFAVHLLYEEVELATARFLTIRKGPPMIEVGSKTDDFLIDVRTGHEA